jgi:hypothetical protein
MHMLLHLIFLCFLLCSSSFRTTFYGYVSDDTIAYTKVSIPATAQRLILYVWCEPTTSSESQRQVLIGINRVPTLGSYDSIIALPTNGEVLSIVEDSPVDSVLYIGLWGGEMLHSYRYFGGAAVYSSVAVVADVVQCDSASQQGFACTMHPRIPLMQTVITHTSNNESNSSRGGITQQGTAETSVTLTTSALNLGSQARTGTEAGAVHSLALSLDPSQERIRLSLRAPPLALTAAHVASLCETFAAGNDSQSSVPGVSLRLKGALYLNRIPEDTHVVYSDVLLNISDMCGEQWSSEPLTFQELSYSLVKPCPGDWTLDMSIYLVNMITDFDIDSDESHTAAIPVMSAGAAVAEEISTIGVTTDESRSGSTDVNTCWFGSKNAFEAGYLAMMKNDCRIQQIHTIIRSSSQERAIQASHESTLAMNVTVETVTDVCAPGFTSSGVDLSVSDCAENIYELDAYSFQDTATFQYTLDSDEYLITLPRSSSEPGQRSVLLRGGLGGMTFSPVGGSMSVEATFSAVGEEGVEVGESGAAVSLQGEEFSIYVQTGGIAHEEFGNGDDMFADQKVVLSTNLLKMNPSSADDMETVLTSQNILKTKQFRWIYHKPNLADIVRHQDGNFFIYFYIIANNETSYSVEDNRKSEGAQFMVNLRVVFSPCLASTCQHGECVVSDDGMLVSSCSCR